MRGGAPGTRRRPAFRHAMPDVHLVTRSGLASWRLRPSSLSSAALVLGKHLLDHAPGLSRFSRVGV